MKTVLTTLGLLAMGLYPGAKTEASQAWQQPYEATPEVIALYHFDEASPNADAGGNQLALGDPRGSDTAFVEEGRFGGALEVSGNAAEDTRQGVSVGNHPALSPEGAFTLELWIQPGPELEKSSLAFLLDKKYLHGPKEEDKNHDYMLILRKSGNRFRVEAQLGFGEEHEVIRSEPESFPAGEWRHVALTYDGNGAAKLYLDGVLIASEHFEGRNAITPGRFPLTIGDRQGSRGARFPGKIDEVRLSKGATEFTSGEEARLEPLPGRAVFVRKEEGAVLRFQVKNLGQTELSEARLVLKGETEHSLDLPKLEQGASQSVEFPIQTDLRPDRYEWVAEVVDASGESIGKPVKVNATLIPRPLPHVMPVVMWGGTRNIELLKEMGFTHSFVLMSQGGIKADAPVWEDTIRRLDALQEIGIAGGVNLNPGRHASLKKFGRTDRSGEPHPRVNVNGLLPEVQEATRAAVRELKPLMDHPGFQAVLVNTELRDSSRPSFSKVDFDAYRKATGAEIPDRVLEARGVNYQKLPGFPVSRLLPDSDPILTYYRWFWKDGDGWNGLHSAASQEVKKLSKAWTWFDPAVRAPSIYGSGGEVDYLNQWIYTYPDPLNIALACDEIISMAKGREGQGVMMMTQAIWYRTQTAPQQKSATVALADWEKEQPDARFITIAPDHLSTALWYKLSYPLDGIMYHGWGSLSGEDNNNYKMTNPDAKARLAKLSREVIEPLGPSLRQIGDTPSDVAFLQSFTSQMMAGRGTYGWGNGWGADSWLMARYAGLPARVINEEEVLAKKLEGVKVLFLTHCDVLSEAVAKEVIRFQNEGGILIGDEHLAPGIAPDFLLKSVKRLGKADQDKATILSGAAVLKEELAPFYTAEVEGSHPEIILKGRTYEGKMRYLFAVNDRREFGDYVGHHGKVMEKGVATEGEVRLRGREVQVYDLIRQELVPSRVEQGDTMFTTRLGPAEGAVYLLLEEKPGTLALDTPKTVARGAEASISVALPLADGSELPAVVPMEVTITDAEGRKAEGSGYYGAAHGKLTVPVSLALNDAVGEWKVSVSERLTGRTVANVFQVSQ